MSFVDTSGGSAVPVEYQPGFRARRVQNWVFLGLMYAFFYMARYNFSGGQRASTEAFGWTNTQYSASSRDGRARLRARPSS